MENFLLSALDSSLDFTYWFVGFFIVFGVLAKLYPCNKNQPLIRDGMLTDIAYGLVIPILSRFVFLLFLAVGFAVFFYNVPSEEIDGYLRNGHGYVASLPLWLQAALVFILSDFLLYWTHRIFHSKQLWKWHAIHHSPRTVDWLTAYRFHPINVFLSFTLVNVLMLLIGFSPASMIIMSGFNNIYSAMVHANLNWTFGKYKYLFASPVFHRWHHTTQKEGLDKNFAPTFPLLDVMFGTFYMPDDKLPEKYGVLGDKIPESFIGQILWPFQR